MTPCLTRDKKQMIEIEGKNVLYLSKKFGTPLFIICEQHLRESYKNFRNLFASHYPRTIVAYAYKANYLPFVCNVIKEEGGWAEVGSSLELDIAKRINVDPKTIIFNGPAKTYQELFEAMKLGVKIINIDSLSELKKIIFLSKKYNLTANIGIRVNTSFFDSKWNKFGLSKKDILIACKTLTKMKRLKYVGLHAHLGTQLITTKPYKQLIKDLVNISEEIKRKYNLDTDFIDIGGGIPVRDLPPKGIKKYQIPSVEEFAKVICSTLKKEVAKSNMKLPFLVLEPGRIIVSSPIFLLLKVIATKRIQNAGKIIFTDGGLNILLESEYFEYDIIPSMIREGKKEKIQIAGPLCMQDDLIGTNRILPPIKEGDILVVVNAGGYSISLSWQFTKTKPAVVLIDCNNKVRLLRRPENIHDIFRLDLFY